MSGIASVAIFGSKLIVYFVICYWKCKNTAILLTLIIFCCEFLSTYNDFYEIGERSGSKMQIELQ